MQIVMTKFAGDRPDSDERYDENAFQNQIDKEMPFKINGEIVGTCRLLGVSIGNGGQYAVLTFEVPEIFEPQPLSVRFADEADS